MLSILVLIVYDGHYYKAGRKGLKVVPSKISFLDKKLDRTKIWVYNSTCLISRQQVSRQHRM